MERRIMACMKCGYVGFVEDLKRYDIDKLELEKHVVKKGLKKIWDNSGFYYMGCPRCEWPIYVMKKKGAAPKQENKKAAMEKLDALSAMQSSEPVPATKNEKRRQPSYLCTCDLCGKKFRSKVGKETRCQDCIKGKNVPR